MRDLSQRLDAIFVAPKFQQDTSKLETLLMSLELKIVLKSLTLYSCNFKTATWMRQNLNVFSFKSKLNEI